MDADIKKRWVEALRSGKYKQGRTFLKKRDEWCCIGVLCDLVDPTKWTEHGGYVTDTFRFFPAEQFFISLGMTDDMGSKLASMNDKGNNFPVIADYIEANL